jgi:hypothetical protein
MLAAKMKRHLKDVKAEMETQNLKDDWKTLMGKGRIIDAEGCPKKQKAPRKFSREKSSEVIGGRGNFDVAGIDGRTFEFNGGMRKFSGQDNYKVKTFLKDLEKHAEMMGWTDLQLMLLGRKMLDGEAGEIFSISHVGFSWESFRSNLLEWYGDRRTEVDDDELMEKPAQTAMEDVDEILMLKKIDARSRVEREEVQMLPFEEAAEETILETFEFGETKPLFLEFFRPEEAVETVEVERSDESYTCQDPAEICIAVVAKTDLDLKNKSGLEGIVKMEKMALDILAGDGRKLKEESCQIVLTEEQLSLLTEGREADRLSENRNVAVRRFEPIGLMKLNGVSVPLSDESGTGENLIFDWLQKQEFSVQENVDLLNSTVKLGDGNRGEVFSLIAEVLWREQRRGVPGRMRRGVKMKWPKKWLEIGPISKLGGVSCRTRITLSNNILFWSLCR